MLRSKTSHRRTVLKPLVPKAIPQADQLYNEIFGEYLLRPIRLARDEPNVYGPGNLRYSLGAFDGPRLIAHAAARPAVVAMDGARLPWASYGNVFTHPEYRGKGIGTRLNKLIWGRLKRAGVDGVYISGGRSLYTRLGATPCGRYFHFHCPARRLRAAIRDRSALAVRRCRRSEANVLVRLHGDDPIAFLRRTVDFAGVLSTGWANLSRAWPWLVVRGGTPLAYVLIGPEWSRSPKASGRATVTDFAGVRAAIVLGLPRIMARARFSSASLSVSGGDRELLTLLTGAGFRGEWHGVDGTQLLLDSRRLFARLRPYFEARLGAREARRFTFRLTPRGGGVFALGKHRGRVSDIQSLTKLMLGDRPARWRRLVPGPRPLQDALARVFPLPFPAVGLNWM